MQTKLSALIAPLLIATLLIPQTGEAFLGRTRTKKMSKLAKEVNKKGADDTEYFEEAFPRDDEIKEMEKESGSLWVDTYSSRMYNNLNRASRVGDMVTIVIDEVAQGQKNASTKTERTSSTVFGISSILGAIAQIPTSIIGTDPSKMIEASHEAEHEGKGTTKRGGSLNATITARVTKVLKNGDLQIRGEKNITVNGEEQVLALEGFIRPYDISSQNTISSNYIADARITFNGFGTLGSQQKPGWLQQIFDVVLPF